MNIEINELQAKIITQALREFCNEIWDDAEIVGIYDAEYATEREYDEAIKMYIHKNVEPIIRQFGTLII